MAEDTALSADWLRIARLAALGVIGPGDLVGTDFVNLFQGGNGDDALNGTDGNDVVVGGGGDDVVTGGGGSDLILSGPGTDTIATGPGVDIVFGTLEDLIGDRIVDFGVEDFLAVSVGETALPHQPPPSIPTLVWPTGVPFVDGLNTATQYDTETLAGHQWGWLFVERGTGAGAYALCSLEPRLPGLSEGVRVDPTSINGVVNEPFLTGDGTVRFAVELTSAISAYANTLGAYRTATDGTISDIQILFSNTLNVASGARTVDLGTPADGERIAFFLIQDGFGRFGSLPDNLSFVTPGTGLPFDSDTHLPPVLVSASLGVIAGVFHSIPSAPGDDPSVLSGIETVGGSLSIAFEDTPKTGDNDFQDVVINVRAIYDSVI